MDEPMPRKRIEMTDPHMFPEKMRLQPKSPSPLHESYFGGGEGRGAAALDGPAISPPNPPPSHDTTAAANDTCSVWGDPGRWSLLGSPTGNWDQHDAVVRTSPSFATQDGDQFTISVPNAELTVPIITEQSGVMGVNGDDGWGGHAPPNKPFENWQASTHSTPPLSAPSFVSFLSHPYMSYTDAHTNTLTHNQSSAALTELFSPGRDVADCNVGFTRAGFGIASTSFEPPLVDTPRIPPFPCEKSYVSEEHTLESTSKFPITHYHFGHPPNPNRYLGEYGFRFPNGNELWYEGQTPGPLLDLPPVTHHSPYRSLLASDTGFESGTQIPTDALGGPISHPHKVLGGRNPPGLRRPRGQLRPKDREETSKTRKRRACIRCRMQKIRVGCPAPNTMDDSRHVTRTDTLEQCIPDPGKPETAYCLCCNKVLGLDTKKVIHRIPCLRWNLNEVVLFRVGGLGFTQRWAGVCVENIPSADWVDERVVTIGMGVTKLFCDPMPLKVRRFKPNGMDIQHRYWKYKETEPPLVVTIPAYALADVDATSEEYRRYVKQNAEEAIRRFVRDTTVNDIVRRTFSVAAKAANRDFGKTKGDPATLFRNYFRLWLASRFTLGSAYVAAGYENLEASTPPCERQFVSRMITAQFDSIGYNHVLLKLKREVLDELWLLMQKRTDATFFTVYLIVFMMLHEVSVACQDRRRRAKEQGLKTYYDLEDVTAKIKHGADIILGHWHYYKGDLDPLTDSEATMARQFGADSAEEIRTLMATRQKYEQMKKKPRGEVDWEDPLYLVSQMFERDWRPVQSCWP
ncbi:hypothetical protein F5B21DRAFT_506957 [Xylaria acuta]|nr:hypothetical protein F5B21DRAFT_506957 [Xylaria acuta]